MNLSRIFIERPVATCLVMVAILLSGLLGYRWLPRAALPQVDYPTIQVVTTYPGASAEVLSLVVTAPLERQLGAMAGLEEMSSLSSAGVSTINLRFGLDSSLDVAEQNVQAAINAAHGYLPQALPGPPVYRKVNPADAAILTLAVTSATLPLTELSDLVETRLLPKLSQVPGVGSVNVSGGQRPAVRVALSPAALRAHGLGVERVRGAIERANSNQAKGNFDGPALSHALETNGQLRTAREYAELVVESTGAGVVRLRDVARVEEGAQDAYVGAWAEGHPAILLGVQRQPGANVIAIVERIREIWPNLEAALPEAVELRPLGDRTETIQSSIHDTQLELLAAVALVVLVIFAFLGSFSATLIPSLAVPLSLIGSFGAMYALGFSLNNLTLMALTLGTGFVVDDAIVMIENVARHVEAGLTPLEAALRGSREIGFTILSLTCSLVAVLIPLLFMGDLVGRLFREFALTLVVAIVISAVVSLTFTPMLCARLLGRHGASGRLARACERAIAALVRAYERALDWALGHRSAIGGVAVLTVLATLGLVAIIPKGFFPPQDTGAIEVTTRGPPGISFARMRELSAVLAESIRREPGVANVSSSVGVDGENPALNTGRLLVNLLPRSERQETAGELARRLEGRARAQGQLDASFAPLQDLTVDTRKSRGAYRYLLESPDAELLARETPRLVGRLSSLPALRNVTHDQEPSRRVVLEVDRDRAAMLGVSVAAIDELLYTSFGQRFVSTIFTQTSQYRVVLELQGQSERGPELLDELWVGGAAGEVPLSSLVHRFEASGAGVVTREKQQPSATISFDLASGTSLGEAVRLVERERSALSPAGLGARFQGAALAFQAALANEGWLVLGALVTMYLVLGILYESFVHPLTILSTLPSAGLGALLALLLFGHDLSVIAIIGIVLLIGIVQKNAIMIIDFALEAEREQGASPLEAIRKACLLRFRPITMTTCAALFSAIPLVLGSGVGSELRRPLGLALVGGLLLSQALTLFTTPVVYLAFDRLRRRGARPGTVAWPNGVTS